MQDAPEPSVMMSRLCTVACQITIDMQCFVIACIRNAKSGLICNYTGSESGQREVVSEVVKVVSDVRGK